MKIQKVIHSCDDKPFYLDFWPIVSKIWRVKFDVEPILLFFGNGDPSQEYGTVIKMPILPFVPVHTQCQFARYWYPSNEPESVCMTSDIDMLPISKYYFVDRIADILDDKMVSFENIPHTSHTHFMCAYNAALGRTFTELLQLHADWETFMLSGVWRCDDSVHKPDGLDTNGLTNWSADEQWSSRRLNNYHNQDRIVKLDRGCRPAYCHRIDRSNWQWDDNAVLHGEYYDAHCVRPYTQHKESIDKLTQLILES